MAFTIRQLQYFVAVAEQGTVSGAAHILSISQSAVTEAIKELEADLGVTLFDRHSRGLNITHNGHQFLRHDIELLQQRYAASWEQICHRLTTLRRPGAEGIPFHLVRTDIAGNISKRFSASGLQLPRYGGACPRWVVHEAYTAPERVIPQFVRLPDGSEFLFVARALRSGAGGYGVPRSVHSVMIGCDTAFSNDVVYGDRLSLDRPESAVPVGISCRQCPREDCAQRAFEMADTASVTRK